MNPTKGLPRPDFSKCTVIPNDQNDRSLSNSPISPTGALSKSLGKLEMQSPRSPRCKNAIIRVMHEIGSEFHQLNDVEIQTLAIEISSRFSGRGTTHLERKQGSVSRTIYYDFDKKVAYIFLKTKGGLPRETGGFKSGTRVVEIVWSKNSKLIEANKCFILASLDKRAGCAQLHKMPFEMEVLSKIEAVAEVTLRCKVFFEYTKVEKASFQCIKKSAAIYPYLPVTLKDHFQLPGIEDSHKLATFYGVARALKLLHAAGITHGDLKDRNVLVNDSGQPVLADFDFGSDLNAGKYRVRPYRYGTLRYTAPEHLVCHDVARLDLRALDMWAFGIMIRPLCRAEFGELSKLQKMESSADSLVETIGLQIKIIYDIQINQKRGAEKALTSLKLANDYSTSLEMLGKAVLHPQPASRPTASKIVEIIESRYAIRE